ncbi:MAG: FAD-dependent oxidoreductase [Aquificaceae bacterium]|nr:FAD-dependent oxidoreductase [Aquificaceae bacterium]MCX7989817.1 FAD-dependent oxidoreductase [Aquificaceae bacterium]MDW8031987.1 FAD-dependent oxidoreductase [Aquificaceae bacterium]MDW8294588.1 FAD-dependent oxidoreductase [Aquificaceae bacterium]
MKYDVIILGGGASGLSCALTLLSSRGRGWDWADNRKYLLFDTDRSDLNRAFLKNVPGLSPMTGKELLQRMRRQLEEWGGMELLQEEVVRVEKKGELYQVQSTSGKEFLGEFVVLASGFHSFKIEGLRVELVENPRSPKPGRVMIKHKDYEVERNLFVAGTLAGLSSHFTSCAGSGVEVAIEILSRFAGKRIVIHDVPEET